MIHRFESLGSTNDQLVRMAEEGAPEYTAVLAERQTRGKGRADRGWWSPPGNLYLSVLLRPGINARRLPRVSILASLALFRAIDDRTGTVSLKWPNDLLLDGRKLAGILPAGRIEGDKVAWVVTGFGVNVVKPEQGVPGELEDRVAFLDEIVETSLDDLVHRIIGEFKGLAGSFEGPAWQRAREEWSRSAVFGPHYTLRDGKRRIVGTPVGLAHDGGLVMETEQGTVTVYAGELEESAECRV
ncbi:MAG: biotin--[acetyl-CoA-carboxylase] ligase [bacterium]|nr:biotin--[acetyl-CoA-carboxylase] ligase [bacterium]MDT8394893.1 biotin--[acetyl-CoA-carboxylase] ligase [bacterium]